jgi:hypothetical protein
MIGHPFLSSCPSSPIPAVHASGSIVMSYRYDHVSLLVSLFHIPVSLGHLLQRIASIDDRSQLACLNELSQEDQILSAILWRPLLDCHKCPVRSECFLAV